MNTFRHRVEQRDPAELLTPTQAANRLAISVRTLYRLLAAGKMPPPVRFNRKLVRFKAADLTAFVRSLDTK